MNNENRTVIRTPRKGARVGDRVIIAGQPVMIVKSGRTEDFVTMDEFAEAMYGKPIDHIVFKEYSHSHEDASKSEDRLAH